MKDEKDANVRDPGETEEDDPLKNARDNVDKVLSDGFMIFLAVLMLPIILIPIFVSSLDQQYLDFLNTADIAIIGIFYVEYLLKLAYAKDRWKHFINAWHILDLIIIMLPLMELFPILGIGLARRSPLLRLVRLARIMAVGGRTVKRRIHDTGHSSVASAPAISMRAQVVDQDFETVKKDISIAEVKKFWQSPSQTWIDISGISEEDLEELSATIGIPNIVLTSKLADESYPRIDYLERHSMIFLLSGSTELHRRGTHHLLICRTGLLIICSGRNIMTISKQRSDTFEEVLKRARRQFPAGRPLLVSILYSILEHIIHKYKLIIGEVEHELLRIENIPSDETPRDFLETTFQLKKEVNRLVSSLLHLKEVLTVIMNRRVPLEGFDSAHEELFDILADETVYLHETAQNSKDDLSSLIELHINTTSYEMNKVMRVIAVITCLAVIPAFIGGMLGMNIIGASWPLLLWQVLAMTLAAMTGVAYMFYKLGWFKT
jgi:Mg2+ and Co2+ transporter CorA